MTIRAEARALLQEVLVHLYRPNAAQFPSIASFRSSHEAQSALLDELLASDHLRQDVGRYALTIQGLRACGSSEAQCEIESCDALLPVLQAAYLENPEKTWCVVELAARARRSVAEVSKSLTFLVDLPIAKRWSDEGTGLVSSIQLSQKIRDTEPIGRRKEDGALEGATKEETDATVETIEIHGYRLFSRFQANLGRLTVILGGNASGKSSLFDFLRFVSFAATNPLPPEIDPRGAGKTLFHGGSERVDFALVVRPGQGKPLRYEVDLDGPVGAPKIVRERLAAADPGSEGAGQAPLWLEFCDGKGGVLNDAERKLERPKWRLEPNELALHRALDCASETLSRFQRFVSSWRFYSGFDVSGAAAIRRPVPTEPVLTLAEDGSNLSAVLFLLMTEYPELWQELDAFLRSAVPGFRSLQVKFRGAPRTVIGTWREEGVPDELTLADLSDGILRLLCWAALCLSPALSPLVGMDEPELGLDPRVLPMLAGLFRRASARSQLLLATRCPRFVRQFTLEEMAILRKEDGRANFVRPRTGPALERAVAELGGDARPPLPPATLWTEPEVRVPRTPAKRTNGDG
jgi:predicted ATPase